MINDNIVSIKALIKGVFEYVIIWKIKNNFYHRAWQRLFNTVEAVVENKRLNITADVCEDIFIISCIITKT